MPSPTRKSLLRARARHFAETLALSSFSTLFCLSPLPAQDAPPPQANPKVPAAAEKKAEPASPAPSKPPTTEGDKPKPADGQPLPAKDPAESPDTPPPLIEPDSLPEPILPPPPPEPAKPRLRLPPPPGLNDPANWSTVSPIARSDDAPSAPLVQYSIPGFYGRAPQVFAVEPGKRFDYGASLGLGYSYDDNPDAQSGSRSIAGQNNSEKESGLIASGTFYLNLQMGSEQQLLLLNWINDLKYHLQGQENPFEYNSRFNATYTYRFFSPAMLSANISLAYLDQPDYSQVNSQVNARNQRNASGDNSSFNTNAKIDYAYRWHPQFTTRTSLAIDSILYLGDSDSDSNWSYTIGNEARFHTDRITWIGEVRYQDMQYVDKSELNSTSVFLLVGAEWQLDPTFQTSFRLGEVIRSSENGDKSASPYGEFGINYRPNLQNTFSFQARYGYEDSGLSQESVAARVGLTYSRIFSKQLSASLAGNIVRTSDDGAETSNTETLFDATLSVNYRVTPRFTLSSLLGYTQNESSDSESDFGFTRKRFTFSARYEF